MRIAIGGFSHETNCFGPVPFPREVFEWCITGPEYYVARNTGVRSAGGGYIDEAEVQCAQLVFGPLGVRNPSAPVVQDAFEDYLKDLVDAFWQAHCQQPLDGILLSMHGAGVTQGFDDLEGETLRAVRQRFGDAMPIAIHLDLHANYSEEMRALSNISVGYKSYPHVDIYETARDTLRLLCQMIREKACYRQALVSLPWLLAPGFGVTLSGAGHDVQQLSKRLVAENDDLLDATFFHGFAYADVAFAGASVVTVARTEEAAQRFAKELARYAWSRRKDFIAPINSAEKAMELAEAAEGLALVHESSDNPGGGTPGDGTHLLREMLKRDLPSAFGFIRDEEVVKQAVQAGVGSTISCRLGGKTDTLHGAPIELEKAYVKAISDGHYIQKNPMGKGAKDSLGTTVLLVVGNVQIVVSGALTQTKDDGPFTTVGVDWRELKVLALKSTHHFKGWWYDKVNTIIPCDSPGVHSSDLSVFNFKKANKNHYPFRDVQWSI